MRKIHSVLRLHFAAGLSRREIARSLSIGYGTVANYIRRAEQTSLSWLLPPQIGERELLLALFPKSADSTAHKRFAEPDYPRIYLDLKSVGMTNSLRGRNTVRFTLTMATATRSSVSRASIQRSTASTASPQAQRRPKHTAPLAH